MSNPTQVELDAAQIFTMYGFRIGGLVVPNNDRDRAACEFLQSKGVAYLDTEREHVGFRHAWGTDQSQELIDRWLAEGVLEPRAKS